MYIDLKDISLMRPADAKKGWLLIGGAHYFGPPMFVFEHAGMPHGFELADPQGGNSGFQPQEISGSKHPYIRAHEFDIDVDVSDDSKVSPTRGEIFRGQIALSSEGPCFVVRANRGSTFFVGLDGEIKPDVELSKSVGFSRWRILIRGPQESRHVLYEAGSQP